MEHYQKVKDRKALGYIWNKVKYLSLGVGGLSITVEVAVLKFILNFIKVENSTKSGYCSYIYPVRDVMHRLCKSLGMTFTEIVLGSWKDILLFLHSNQIPDLVDIMKTSITPSSPMSEAMVSAIFDYFSGAFPHDAHSHLLLKLFENGTENLPKAFDIISKNSENYTSSALLQIASKHFEMLKSESEKLLSGNVFNDYVEAAITCALKKKEPKSESHRSSNGEIFPSEKADPNIQWVFQAFLFQPARAVAKSQQFKDIISLVFEAYKDDIQTILSLFDHIKSQKILLGKCKPLFGHTVVELITKHTHDTLELLRPNKYKMFMTELEKVQSYFGRFVVKGQNAFENLLKEIKRKHMSKKKLLADIETRYSFS